MNRAGRGNPAGYAMTITTSAVKVIRAFCIGGKPQAVGTVIEVGLGLAAELIAARKAEKHVAEAAPAKPAKEPKPAAKDKEPKE